MTPITFWYDPISPYAYLAFEQLPQVLEGCSVAVFVLSHVRAAAEEVVQRHSSPTASTCCPMQRQHGIADQR